MNFFQISSSYDEFGNLSNLMKTKYNSALELYDDMTRNLPRNRPNCEEILKRKHLWALTKEEFEIHDELKKEIIFKINNTDSIYSILRPKFKFM
jgi:hypothetical protein